MARRPDVPSYPIEGPGTRSEDVARARNLARLLDEAIRIPGTGIGIGLDAVVGLIPGVGDLAGGLMSAYVLATAARAGVPKAVLGRMLVNLATDSLVGTVPVLGDLFDVGYKANTRNVRLLEQALAAPEATRRSSGLVVAGVVLAALAIAAVGVAASIWVIRTLWGAFGG